MAKIRSVNPSISFIRDYFKYDPDEGILYKIKSKRSGYHPIVNLKRRHVVINGMGLIIARLCWALQTGAWPKNLIDHRDGDHTNIKWSNLREATHQQNQFNKVSYGKYPKGVVFKHDANRTKPWSARIRINGKKVVLGAYYTMEAAAAAYRKKAEEIQGEFALHKSMKPR